MQRGHMRFQGREGKVRRSVPTAAVLVLAAALSLACVAGCQGGPQGGVQRAASEIAAAGAAGKAAEAFGASGSATHASAARDVTADDMLGIPSTNDIVLVDLLTGASDSAQGQAALADVRDCVAAIEQVASCGFVFADMGTGRCLAYNAGQELYIASAAKAPLTLFALQHGAGADEAERSLIEYAIVESDNDSYEGFAYTYTDEEYARWLSAHGVDHENYAYDLYPLMSARSLASFWVDILRYVQGGAGNAPWFADLLASTDTSFIRDGLYDTGASVMDKGGWINEGSFAYLGADGDDDGDEPKLSEAEEADLYYRSVTDAAIIEHDGHTYLMVIVTSQPDSGTAEANVSELARALFEARTLL